LKIQISMRALKSARKVGELSTIIPAGGLPGSYEDLKKMYHAWGGLTAVSFVAWTFL
jgi:hypothetical protein